MATKGITFSLPLVRALLAGEKTMTRRLLKLPVQHTRKGEWRIGKIGGNGMTDSKGKPYLERPCVSHSQTGAIVVSPTAIGDRLYVREQLERANGEAIGYPADGTWLPNSSWRWKNKGLSGRYMPRDLSRMWLDVTDVRIERLQDISEGDCYYEGVKRPSGPRLGSDVTARDNARIWFRDIWDGLHDREGERWADNPFVTVICFDVKRGNIDQDSQ